MSTITVKTKEELKKAVAKGTDEIIVVGKLANDLKKSKKIMAVSAITLAILTAAIATIPFTGGISVVAAGTIAALTGLEIVQIIAISSVGVALNFAVHKGYNVKIVTQYGTIIILTKKTR